MILYCNDPKAEGCTWSGELEELVSETEAIDDKDFSFCPTCGGDDFTKEEDEDTGDVPFDVPFDEDDDEDPEEDEE